MIIKRLRCYLISVRDYFRCRGAHVCHVFKNISIEENTMIAVSNNGFRRVLNYEHSPGEQIIDNAVIITDKCIFCGEKVQSWYRKENFDKVRERIV